MNKLNKIIYVAALLEGEGYFVIHRGVPSIVLNMCCKDIVEKYKNFLNDLGSQSKAGIKIRKPAKITYKPVYHYEITGQWAILIMKLILPYMGLRRSNKIKMIIGEYYAKH